MEFCDALDGFSSFYCHSEELGTGGWSLRCIPGGSREKGEATRQECAHRTRVFPGWAGSCGRVQGSEDSHAHAYCRRPQLPVPSSPSPAPREPVCLRSPSSRCLLTSISVTGTSFQIKTFKAISPHHFNCTRWLWI